MVVCQRKISVRKYIFEYQKGAKFLLLQIYNWNYNSTTTAFSSHLDLKEAAKITSSET